MSYFVDGVVNDFRNPLIFDFFDPSVIIVVDCHF